ncbi:MAG TPA: hypothetical protein VGM75_38325 [Pseudonocardiaceae bacterium]
MKADRPRCRQRLSSSSVNEVAAASVSSRTTRMTMCGAILASALVVTALQDIPHLQPKLWAQPVKPHAFVGRKRDLAEAPGELSDVWPAVDLPGSDPVRPPAGAAVGVLTTAPPDQ